MILHIAKDDKFVEQVVNIFEAAAEGKNNYVIWKPALLKWPTLFQKIKLNNSSQFYSNRPSKNKCVKSDFVVHNHDKIQIANYGSQDFFSHIGDLKKYKVIIFHSMVYNHAKLAEIIKLNLKIPIIWSPFGYEVYNMLPEFKKDLYLEETKKLVDNARNIQQCLQNLIDSLKAKKIRKAISLTDYCAIAIDTEYESYKKNLNPNLKRFWFTYYPIDLLCADGKSDTAGANILVGNSAFPSNNHIEAFNLLSKINLEGRDIICPLSYGDKTILKETLAIGNSLFGQQFKPLIEFMPIHEYHKLTGSCNVVIMNQSRQQAFGNVLSALWQGSKVYLRPGNTIYSYLKGKGVFIFNIDEDCSEFSNDLKADEIKVNREFIAKEYHQDTIIRRTKEMLSVFI